MKTLITYQELVAWRAEQVANAQRASEPMFLGKPEKWYRDVRWFCTNGHVSGRYLRTDGSDRCLACRQPVFMGPRLSEETFQHICYHIASTRK